MRHSAKGLSIGELVVATGLLAMMLVTLMVLFGRMLDSTTKGAMVSQATFLADRVIETEIYRVQAGLPPQVGAPFPSFPCPQQGSEFLYSQDETLRQEFVYSIDLDRIDDQTTGSLYTVDVVVKWWLPGDQVRVAQENKRGMGRLSISRNRVVYLQKN